MVLVGTREDSFSYFYLFACARADWDGPIYHIEVNRSDKVSGPDSI